MNRKRWSEWVQQIWCWFLSSYFVLIVFHFIHLFKHQMMSSSILISLLMFESSLIWGKLVCWGRLWGIRWKFVRTVIYFHTWRAVKVMILINSCIFHENIKFSSRASFSGETLNYFPKYSARQINLNFYIILLIIFNW